MNIRDRIEAVDSYLSSLKPGDYLDGKVLYDMQLHVSKALEYCASQRPRPLSPAEWLAGWNKEKYGDEFPAGVIPAYSMEEMVSMLEEYAAHVARLESRDVRHQAAEIVIGYHDDGLTFLVEAIHRDIMNIPFPARPDGEKHEPPC